MQGALLGAHGWLLWHLRAWSGRQVMDMEIQPGARTRLAYRLLGIAFIVIGAGMLFVELR